MPEGGHPENLQSGFSKEMMIEAAENHLALKEEPTPLLGGEMVVSSGSEEERERSLQCSLELKDKKKVLAAASLQRMGLAMDADALSLCVEAVEGIQNPSPIEKSLAHQFAASYQLSMKLLAKINHMIDSMQMGEEIKLVERLIPLVTKLMNSCQNGYQALLRGKNGGKQEVVVQHIHVEKEAQAVVAGRMDYPDPGACKSKGPGKGRGTL